MTVPGRDMLSHPPLKSSMQNRDDLTWGPLHWFLRSGRMCWPKWGWLDLGTSWPDAVYKYYLPLFKFNQLLSMFTSPAMFGAMLYFWHSREFTMGSQLVQKFWCFKWSFVYCHKKSNSQNLKTKINFKLSLPRKEHIYSWTFILEVSWDSEVHIVWTPKNTCPS